MIFITQAIVIIYDLLTALRIAAVLSLQLCVLLFRLSGQKPEGNGVRLLDELVQALITRPSYLSHRVYKSDSGIQAFLAGGSSGGPSSGFLIRLTIVNILALHSCIAVIIMVIS